MECIRPYPSGMTTAMLQKMTDEEKQRLHRLRNDFITLAPASGYGIGIYSRRDWVRAVRGASTCAKRGLRRSSLEACSNVAH